MRIMMCHPGEAACPLASTDEALRAIHENPSGLVWMDFDAPLTPSELLMLSAPPFEFHELSLEDASKEDGQRAKAEAYPNHFFLVMHAVSISTRGMLPELAWSEIDIFGGQNYLVSVHRRPLPEIDRVWGDVSTRQQILAKGSDRLTYYLLDAVVDRYLDVIDNMEDVLDRLEDAVLDPTSDESAIHDILTFKRVLTEFRRKGTFLREPVNEMMSRAFPFINEESIVYLRDVYDHLIRITDMMDTYRDTLTSALDVHLSAVSNRLNIIMKRLTVVATIFMPLTFLTGFWGMNFEQLPFGSGQWFWGSVALMAMVTVVMVVLFRTRDYK